MEERKLYERIVFIACAILAVMCGLSLLIKQDWTYPLSVFIGGLMAIVGFLWIIYSTGRILQSKKATTLAMTNYLIRYLVYGGILLVGILSGLNILAMLIGFLCINFAIKVNTYLERKEED